VLLEKDNIKGKRREGVDSSAAVIQRRGKKGSNVTEGSEHSKDL